MVIGGVAAGVAAGLLIVVPVLWLLFRDRNERDVSPAVAAAADGENQSDEAGAQSTDSAASADTGEGQTTARQDAGGSTKGTVPAPNRPSGTRVPARSRPPRVAGAWRGASQSRVRIVDPAVEEGAAAAGAKLVSLYSTWRDGPRVIEVPPQEEVSRRATERADAIETDLRQAYAEFGSRNAQWDDLAEKAFAKEARRRWPEGATAGWWDDLAAQVAAAGCDDPLVLALCGMGLIRDGAFAEAEPVLKSADEKFAASGYPRRFGWTLSVAAADASARAMDTFKANAQFASAEPALARLFEMAHLAAAEIDGRDDRRRKFLDDLDWVEQRLLLARREELRQLIVATNGLDDWTKTMIASGGAVRDIAFDRQAKYVANLRHRDVRAVRAARVELLKAWDAHPERPDAAAALIVATAALGGAVEEPPRFWFDQAVQAEFDFFPAYDRLLAAQRFEFGGTLYDMYEFGEECLDTERFDTPVPTMFEIALERMRAVQQGEILLGGMHPGTGGSFRGVLIRPDYNADPREVYRSPRALDNLRRLVAGRIEAGADEDEARRLRVLAAVRAWESGNRAEANRLIADLDAPADAAVKIRFPGSGNFLLEGRNVKLHLQPDAVDLEMVRSALAKPVPAPSKIPPHEPFHLAPTGVRSIDLSPDGKQLLTAGEMLGWCSIADLETGMRVRTFDGPVFCYCAAYSPDGKEVASGWRDGWIRIFDAQTGELARSLPGHSGPVSSLAFSADGTRLATTESSTPGVAVLWEWPSLVRVAKLEGHELPVWKAAFSPDNRWLATVAGGGFDGFSNARARVHNRGEVRLWDPETGAPASVELNVSGNCRAVAFAPDSGILAVSEDAQRLTRFTKDDFDRFRPRYRLKLWRIADGKIADPKGTPLLPSHTHAIQDIAFTPDGKNMISGATDGTARIWDVESAKPVGTLGGHLREARVVLALPDGERILTGDRKGTVRFWPLRVDETLASRIQEVPGQLPMDERVRGIGFSADGSRAFVLHEARGWTAWENRPGMQTAPHWGQLKEQSGHELIYTGAVAPDGTMLFDAIGSPSHTRGPGFLRDSRTGKLLHEFTTSNGYPFSAKFSPDGQLLAIGGSRNLSVWSLDAPKPQMIAIVNHGSFAQSVDWSPDGKTIAYGLKDKTIGLLDVPASAPAAGATPAPGNPRRTFTAKHPVFYVAYLDERRLAFGAAAKSTVVDVGSGAEVGTFVGGVLAVSPDRTKMLVSLGGAGGDSAVFDTATLKSVQGGILHGIGMVVDRGAFSRDGRYVAAGATDGKAAVYDLVEKKHVWHQPR